MLKITAVLSLLVVVGSVWSSGLSCGSCGPECAPSCGTRRFRACCFNYLRRKRTDTLKELSQAQNFKKTQPESISRMFSAENSPVTSQWANNELSNENQLYYTDDTIENHLYY